MHLLAKESEEGSEVQLTWCFRQHLLEFIVGRLSSQVHVNLLQIILVDETITVGINHSECLRTAMTSYNTAQYVMLDEHTHRCRITLITTISSTIINPRSCNNQTCIDERVSSRASVGYMLGQTSFNSCI